MNYQLKRNRYVMTYLTAVLFALAMAQPSWAQNVDLVTLPNRNTVRLTIYNSEDITLARETRMITLKKGANRLQFSWAGTLIDPTSVTFRPLQFADQIDVADTVYPGQKPQHLIWNIESEVEGQVAVEVSYFTSGLTWSMDYVATTDPAEKQLKFRGHVRVFNRSGEEYENAQVRLVVGKINLVEKIAVLARQRKINLPRSSAAVRDELRKEVLLGAMAGKAGAGFGGGGGKPKQVAKSGVSEYFLFSVAGEETIRNGWSKRMQAVAADQVPFDIVYRLREHQYGTRPVRFFIWGNDEPHHLGDSPLPNGVVRVFRENGSDGLSYLGQTLLRYVPIQGKIEVNLGADDLVVYRRTKTATSRFNFRFNVSNRVVGWDERQVWVDEVRNYRSGPIQFEIHRVWPGDVNFKSTRPVTLFDYRTVAAEMTVQAKSSVKFSYVATIRQAGNVRQNRVKLQRGNP